MSRTPDQWADWIRDFIQEIVAVSPQNSLNPPGGEKSWSDPLVGFCRGDDPVFAKIKENIGEHHWSPEEYFAMAFPETPALPRDLTVISWILPQTPQTIQDNAQATSHPSERWARSRFYGEEFNDLLRRELVKALQAWGVPAGAPMLHPEWKQIYDDPKHVISSKWSERHAAYSAGLGTFGLCDGLITPKGKAMRAGSVVVKLPLPSTPRPYKHHREYCLFYRQGTCGKCIPRCPAGALSVKGHDKEKCRRFTMEEGYEYIQKTWGFNAYGCGLCQTAVPCAGRIPALEEG